MANNRVEIHAYIGDKVYALGFELQFPYEKLNLELMRAAYQALHLTLKLHRQVPCDEVEHEALRSFVEAQKEAHLNEQP